MLIADVQIRIANLVPHGWSVGTTVGIVLASTFVVQTVVSPFWGTLSDRIGRKPVLVLCTALSALAMLVYGLADSVLVLFLSRVLAGFSGANVSVAQALIADLFDADTRSVALGRIGAAVTTGLVIGPPVGGFIAKYANSHAVGFIAAGLSAIGVLILALTVPPAAPRTEDSEPIKQKQRNWRLLSDYPALRRYALIAIVAWSSLATLEGTFLRLIRELFNYDQRHFGLIFGYESVLGVIVQAVLLAILAMSMKGSTILRIAYAMQGIGLALNPIAGNFGVSPLIILFVASTIYATGSGVANPTVNGICSKLCPPERQGELFGMLQGTRSVGFILGPVVGGIMLDKWAPMPYLFAGSVCVVAALLVPSEETVH